MSKHKLYPAWQGEINFNGFTDVGKVRHSNQDSFLLNPDQKVFVVADGMGGRAGGEIASQLAVQTIDAEMAKLGPNFSSLSLEVQKNTLSAAVNRASLVIYEQSLEQPQYKGMGTTTTMLWLPHFSKSNSTHIAIVAHVGDSRCYLSRAGFLFQITNDHSMVNEQIKAGILKKNDPMIHQIRNVITRCIGYQEEEEVDTFAIELASGDTFMMCSDGLTNKVTDAEIGIHLNAPYSSSIAESLVKLANENGGEDNITAVVVNIK